MKNTLSLVALLLMLVSCEAIQKPILDPATGKFPAKYPVKPFSVITQKNINLRDYTQFLYVRPSGVLLESEPPIVNYTKYLMDALKLVGGFDLYFETKDLEQYIVDQKLAEKGVNTSSAIVLHRLSNRVGKFLICDVNIRDDLSKVFLLDFKITDPANNQVVFHVKYNGGVGSRLERSLFNPVLNRYNEWVKANTM